MADENSLTGRVRRYAQVGTAVGGLAARLAGQRYLGIGIDRERHAADLTAALGGLKGPLMKVAQLLATIPEALPREYAAELSQLQSDAPPMGWPFVKRRMAAELGPDWQGRFASFEREAAAAASLGQVHRAVGHDGTQLAVKLQYPDMGSAVEADLAQLKLIFAIYNRSERAIDTGDIREEISARLREELDYRLESRHMALFGAILADEPGLSVPRPVAELTSGRCLTMTWLDGVKLDTLMETSQERRDRLAKLLFRAWYVPFYEYGAIHGDPHLGNYSVSPEDGLNLLDFGCIRTFTPGFVRGVIDLYHAIERDDRDLAVSAYERWGFRNLSGEMISVLNRWAAFLYAPLLDDRIRTIHEGVDGRTVVQDVHGELRRLGGVKPPREFVFMDRAAIGLGSVFTRLKAQVNWHRLFKETVGEFSEEALAARQSQAFAQAGVPPPC